jgi:hypothetical protein
MAIQSTSANLFAIVSGKLMSLILLSTTVCGGLWEENPLCILVGMVPGQHHDFEVGMLHCYTREAHFSALPCRHFTF